MSQSDPVSMWKLLGVAFLCCAMAQQECSVRTDNILTPSTMVETLNMSCVVDPAAVVNSSQQYIWKWLRLAPDNSIEERIEDGTTSEREMSVFTLQVQCESSGFYQAFYYNALDNGTCLFSCFFPIEVEETREEVLREDFSAYPTIMNEVVPASPSDGLARSAQQGTVQSTGTCGDNFYLPSTCVVKVRPTWYRNGSRFNPRADPENYVLFAGGELRIRNLTQATVGYYVCVTTVDGLGSFMTHDTNIILAMPTTPSTANPTSDTGSGSTTTDMVGERESLFGTLKAWEFGLIIGAAAFVISGILLTGAVWMGKLTVKRRRDNKKARVVRYKRHTPHRPKSMMEEIKLMEEADEVDFTDQFSSGPVEIPFNCILFEELLHKGTFKMVHHGVVNHPNQGILGAAVAVKRLKDEKSELGYEELMNEAVLLRTFQEKVGSHHSIVTLLGLTTHGGPTCLLLDYVPNGTLDEFLVTLRQGPIPEWYIKFVRETLRGAYHKHVSGDLMSIIVQVAEGMKFLTDQGFIHRDLSTRNILMGERLNVKIGNPGMHHEGYYYVVSEREHFFQDMAPECLWEKGYSVWSDVWSFGILIYRTVTLNATPFPNMEVDQLHGRMVGGERPQLLASFSNEMYFLLQRCWQFVATERPSFTTISSDLNHMAEKPTRHIILKSTKDHAKPGHISENGQVFLRGLPSHALDEEVPQKKSRRNSGGTMGTMRSLISSIDDTVYTRETAETVLDLTQSETETENYNNYERYLKGDVSLPLKPLHRRSYDETDTSGNDGNTTQERRRPSKPSQETSGDNADAVSAGKASGGGAGSGRKKKRRSNSGKGKRKTTPSYTNKAFSLENTSPVGMDGDSVSSDGAPSITDHEEEEEGKVATSDMSGSDLARSQSELITTSCL